jgi:hypothetical protein
MNMHVPQFFRDIYFETGWILEEIGIRIKHPSRKGDLGRHISALAGHLFWHPWYCLKRGIVNLYRWFPTIWGLDVFDHYYLTDMMDKQLADMEKFFSSDMPVAMGHKRVAKQIRWTRRLYRLWMDDHYATTAYNEHSARFPEDRLKSEPCAWDEWGYPTLFKCEPMPEDARDDYAKTSAGAWEKDEKCFRLYIKQLRNLRRWWD